MCGQTSESRHAVALGAQGYARRLEAPDGGDRWGSIHLRRVGLRVHLPTAAASASAGRNFPPSRCGARAHCGDPVLKVQPGSRVTASLEGCGAMATRRTATPPRLRVCRSLGTPTLRARALSHPCSSVATRRHSGGHRARVMPGVRASTCSERRGTSRRGAVTLRETWERWLRACRTATQMGAEEPGNESPISTRRAAPTGKPRRVSWLALSPLEVGFPGQCESSVFPLPTGEGAEGEG